MLFPFAIHTTSFVKWLINEASFGLFTFKESNAFFCMDYRTTLQFSFSYYF